MLRDDLDISDRLKFQHSINHAENNVGSGLGCKDRKIGSSCQISPHLEAWTCFTATAGKNKLELICFCWSWNNLQTRKVYDDDDDDDGDDDDNDDDGDDNMIQFD